MQLLDRLSVKFLKKTLVYIRKLCIVKEITSVALALAVGLMVRFLLRNIRNSCVTLGFKIEKVLVVFKELGGLVYLILRLC